MRATAKWILAALAAVGAVLLAGVPLTAMRSAASTGRLLAALGGLLIALAGIGWALWFTSEALMPRLLSYRDLATPRFAEIAALIDAEPELFLGPSARRGATTLVDFDASRATHRRALAEVTRLLAAETDPTRRQTLAAACRQAAAWVADDYARLSRISALMYAWDVRSSVRRARFHTFVGCGITLVGALCLVLSTSGASAGRAAPPAPPAASHSATSATSPPAASHCTASPPGVRTGTVTSSARAH
ncbi:hypothetical protein ACH4ZX_27815 [Streptomyces sp. NPDC020490]|uniref:hypothetical protein n=1 Tax=Streptomyces sp. NPDC020490 TaxID=3365078 RepID=UPI0037892E98